MHASRALRPEQQQQQEADGYVPNVCRSRSPAKSMSPDRSPVKDDDKVDDRISTMTGRSPRSPPRATTEALPRASRPSPRGLGQPCHGEGTHTSGSGCKSVRTGVAGGTDAPAVLFACAEVLFTGSLLRCGSCEVLARLATARAAGPGLPTVLWILDSSVRCGPGRGQAVLLGRRRAAGT